MPAGVAAPSGQVTFVFTDIESSTRLARLLGEEYQRLLDAHRRVLRAHLAIRGVELFTEGDSFFLAFADAGAAIAGCLDAQRALAGGDWPGGARPRVRMGLHTGYAVPRAGEYASPEVHRAARVASAAHGGQVLCSAAAIRAAAPLPAGVRVRDLGLHRLRGFDGRTRLLQLSAAGVGHDFPRPRTSGVVRHNLPAAPTPFVGRGRERRELAGLLREHRLVTVVGPPGVGKTRLAVRVAGGLTERFADGVWYVDLTGVPPAGVPQAVAAGLGVRLDPGGPLRSEIAELADAHDMLLVVDTCEVAPEVLGPLATRLLTDSPQVRLLVVGRQPLGVAGECVWRTPPLGCQAGPGGEPGDAVALLLRRAEAARGGRPVERRDAAVLHRVAVELEGLPLALELAAARLRCVPVPDLPGQVADLVGAGAAGRPGAGPSPRGPAGPAARATDLAASVAWSYHRLTAPAARLLRALSVFAGPVPADAVRGVVRDDAWEPLAALVDASLVQAQPHPGGVRYRLLRPVRAYAAAQLAALGEEPVVRGRHARWVERELLGMHVAHDGRPVTWDLSAIDPLRGEVTDALAWSATAGDPWQGLRLVNAAGSWWVERGESGTARLWLCRLYGRLGGPDGLARAAPAAEAALLAGLFLLHSQLAAAGGDAPARAVFAARAGRLAAQVGDPALRLRVEAWAPPRPGEAGYREVLRRAAVLRLSGDAFAAVEALARLLWERGALGPLTELLTSSRAVEASRPAVRGRRAVDLMLGMVALARGDLPRAHEHLTAALRAQVAFGFELAACEAVAALAVRFATVGDLLTAARLFGAADANRTARHGVAGPFAAFLAQREERARAAGRAAFDAAYAQGATWSIAEAAEVALGVCAPRPRPVPADAVDVADAVCSSPR